MKSPQNDPLSDGKYEFATLKGWGKEYWKGSKSIEIAQILVDWNVEFQLNYYYILHPFRTMSLWKRSDSNRKFLQPSWTNSEITRDILGEKRFILWDSYLTSLMGGPRRKCPSMSTKLPFGRSSEIRPKQIPGWFCDGASVINRGALLFLGGIIELHLAHRALMKSVWVPITSEVFTSSPSIWKFTKIIEDEPRLCPRCTSASSFSFNAESEGFSWATSLSEVSSEKPAKTKSVQTDTSIAELHFVNALPTNRKEEPPARLPCYVAGRQSQNVARLYWSISPPFQPPRPNIKVQWVDPGPNTNLAMENSGATKKARSWSMAWWPDDHEWDHQIICGISFGWSHFGWSTLVKCCLKFEWLNRHFTAAWLIQKTHGARHSTSTGFLWRYGESVIQIK